MCWPEVPLSLYVNAMACYASYAHDVLILYEIYGFPTSASDLKFDALSFVVNFDFDSGNIANGQWKKKTLIIIIIID